MDDCRAAGPVFMCQLCNLFSPSRSPLLAHCSQLHPEAHPDDIITVLQPLVAAPVETPEESQVKRKRGRPKGSTKKSKTDSPQAPEEDLQDIEKGSEKEINQKNVIAGENNDEILGLNCRNCHRTFSNRRQILKHICYKDEQVEEYEEVKGKGNHGNPDHDKIDLSKNNQITESPGPVKQNDRTQMLKERGPVTENKNSVFGFVLAENESLPGIYKIVPVEDDSAETVSKANKHQAQSVVFKSRSKEPENLEENPDPNEEQSLTYTKTAVSRGFQEFSIKQDSASLHQSKLKIFTCEFCNKIFKFRHTLVAHLRVHTQEKPFQCPHCDYASTIKANLNVHLRKHTGEKFSCPHCPFSCLSPGHLKVHIERVHMKVKQHCTFCDKKYSDVKNLLKHVEKKHDLKDPAVYQSYQQIRLKTRQGLRQLLFHCPTCNRHFKNQMERERHMLVHGPQRPFVCSLCDHAATKMEALVAHVRKHLFLYVCSECDRKFVSSQRLKSHLQESHTELDQEQGFSHSINKSYYLIQPGGDMWGDEDRDKRGEDKGEVQGELRKEKKDEDERPIQMEGVNGGQEEKSKGTPQREVESQSESTENVRDTNKGTAKEVEEETMEEGTPTKQQTATTTGSTKLHVNGENLPTTTAEAAASSEAEKQTTDQDSEVFHQSAFEQVFSSLRKTRLNMETLQRLRTFYGDLECQYCGKLFWYKVHYNVHIRTHTKEHLHYCTKCNYSSITKSSLKRHQIQKHSGMMLCCSNPECKYTTPDKYKLQAHQRTHQEQGKSVTCPVCQRSYSEHRLKHHIKTSHPDSLPVQRAEKCPYCDSFFLKNSRDFQQHIWAHQGLKPYMCGVCNYAGRSRSNLKTHMNRHNTEKRHLCDLCGKKFKSKVTLKSHRQNHTEEGKRFQCSECDFTSFSKPYLVRHMEQHAAFKPFRCAHCHYSCNLAGPLKRHYHLKHPDQKYENAGPQMPNLEDLKEQGGKKCPECEFVYGTTWELNRHLKSKHRLKVVEGTWEGGEVIEAQYVTVEDEEQLTEAPVAALDDNDAVKQMSDLHSEAQQAVSSMAALAPGTVAVVQQVSEEEDLGGCENQLMVVNAEEELTGEHVMVMEDTHALEALTVLTQGENTHHYIVYVEEHTVEIN
ncbi:zinc finger protein ZFAT isoform X2 [Cynoglossus semilaevis]|uniref:zinc finger protein ZFAT isoform X2 n=1 Tax=Cynoglossus semilaevis TaxID=244447 RepID=UPI000497CCE2|nr:zinc finger protein ZFAT isoform X2 [Cynoglossus semilaevis]